MNNSEKRGSITILFEKNPKGLTIPEIIKKTGMKREEVLYKLYKLSRKGEINAKENPENLDIEAEIKKELLKNRKKTYEKHKKRISKAVTKIKNKISIAKDKIKGTINNKLSKIPSKEEIKKSILRKELISYNLRKEKAARETENKNNLFGYFKKIQPKKEIPSKNISGQPAEKSVKVFSQKKENINQANYTKTKEHLKKPQDNKRYNFALPVETGLFLNLIERIKPQQISRKEENFLEKNLGITNKPIKKTNKGMELLELGKNFLIKTKKYIRHNKNKLNKLKSRKLFNKHKKEENNFNVPSAAENFFNLINPEYKAAKERRFFKEQFWKRYREKHGEEKIKAAEENSEKTNIPKKDTAEERTDNNRFFWKSHLSEYYKRKYEEKKELNQEERKALQQTFSHHFMKKKELDNSSMLPLIKSVQEHFKIESKKREPVLSQDPQAKRNRENIYRMLKSRGIDAKEPEY